MTIGLYAIVNKINGRAYIGSSKHVELRLRHHKCYINRGLFLHYQGYSEDAKQYGVDAFDFKVICATDTVEEALMHKGQLEILQELFSDFNLETVDTNEMTYHSEI